MPRIAEACAIFERVAALPSRLLPTLVVDFGVGTLYIHIQHNVAVSIWTALPDAEEIGSPVK